MLRKLQLEGRLAFLTPQVRGTLNEKLSALDERVMPHSLAILLGIDYSEALLLLTILGKEGVCRNRLLIYHNCEPDVPIGSIPFGSGYPNLPFVCRNCDAAIEDLNELSYDLESTVIIPAELVEDAPA